MFFAFYYQHIIKKNLILLYKFFVDNKMFDFN